MADSKVTSAATALEPMRKRGRPKGSGSFRTKTGEVDIRATVDALTNIAASCYAREWDWDANDYPSLDWDVSYSPPDMAVLNKYSELLLVLIRLASYDQPINVQSAVCLRELLIHLHTRFEIFPEYSPDQIFRAGLSATVPSPQQTGGD